MRNYFRTTSTEQVKSAILFSEGVLFSTAKHIKYTLGEGKEGVIRSNLVVQYLVFMKASGHLLFFQRGGADIIERVNVTEFKFKESLINRKVGDVANLLKTGEIVGKACLQLLQEEGMPEIALEFEKDDSAKFRLALLSGNIEAALYAAMKLKDKNCFVKLATYALNCGNTQILEMALQKVLNFQRLNYLYLLTGNYHKMDKMILLGKEKLNDPLQVFNTTIPIGNIIERIKVLASIGQCK